VFQINSFEFRISKSYDAVVVRTYTPIDRLTIAIAGT